MEAFLKGVASFCEAASNSLVNENYEGDDDSYDEYDEYDDDNDCDEDDESSIWFQPWVGDDYWSGGIFGKKILVIGNSHYCGSRNECSSCGVDGCCFDSDEDCSTFTTDVINEYLDQDGNWEAWMNTYDKFEKALVGYDTDSNDEIHTH